MYKFRGWSIETNVNEILNVVIDKDENHLIMFDEDKDLFAWIYPSELGEGLAFEKMSWAAQFHVLPSEKKIIIKSSRKSEEN
ncbi:hypothetical protein [Metabacillus fastidiosus]|uniref:hypothetical protein n=1 Tax=Metabacillus fastidiosus TaxID=1458 RepID=UPI002E219CC5|nr:hypothetical protein [Metabacillus fastidiosus]